MAAMMLRRESDGQEVASGQDNLSSLLPIR